MYVVAIFHLLSWGVGMCVWSHRQQQKELGQAASTENELGMTYGYRLCALFL
jgi:hypothetical protein